MPYFCKISSVTKLKFIKITKLKIKATSSHFVGSSGVVYQVVWSTTHNTLIQLKDYLIKFWNDTELTN